MPPRLGKRVATVTTRSDLTPEVQGGQPSPNRQRRNSQLVQGAEKRLRFGIRKWVEHGISRN